ncbi:Non-specific lipid-transfer protein [Dorcoceras hygrometricum]|uniref:Non-specific lipid-transfer protein n=1 Tax=Dorcoceras hygrometricum TaxID=472368 RepID=A0A2Z7ANE0_9LAMI|nr:Non-specific lipid-transfer protein [Dorcoceras hygrometricum]
MPTSTNGSKIWVLGILISAYCARHAGAVPCTTAVATLWPCVDYLTGRESSVTVPCCQGADSVNRMVKTKPEMQSLCECLKPAAAELGVISARVAALPDLCKITVPIPISTDVDCNKYV